MQDRFAHSKPWGAECLTGGARFRLWAPAQQSVGLACERGSLPMRRDDDGWFEIETDAVPVDGAYAFELADGRRVPDPAARAQIADVHGASRLIDPLAYRWRSARWRGRAWEQAVVYELHVGCFTPEGTFDGVRSKLDHLVELGVTAIELMPIAQFSGARGWGYDGVLLYAPHVAYGGPEGLKRLIDEAHERELMVLLDVVYNHFGPDGNYLHLYAPEFFDESRHTPWGAAIAFDRRPVRDFFVHNALYWLQEYRFDGLRLDAIDQIADDSQETILEEIARLVRRSITDREIHLTTEDDRNITSLHERDADGRPKLYTAEWNDDWHHAVHVALTNEDEGYYQDYQRPWPCIARALAEGFVQQGDPSPFRDGRRRGEPSAHLPPTAFVNFLQNHDQIGNRALGERITRLAPGEAVEAALALLLLAPHIPLLYMGEEWGELRPFLFFADFKGDLGRAVREGRRKEFSKWPQFQAPENRERIPDPNDPATFAASKLDWDLLDSRPHQRRLELVTALLRMRSFEIVPWLEGIGGNSGRADMLSDTAFHVAWRLAGSTRLCVWANLSAAECSVPPAPRGDLYLLHETPQGAERALAKGRMVPWSVVWRVMRRDLAP